MLGPDELMSIAEEYIGIYDKLGKSMEDLDLNQNHSFPENFEKTLENLIYGRTYHLMAFRILLRYYPDNAIHLLKGRFLSVDLPDASQDLIFDLDIMLDDVKIILGREKLEEIIASKDFLPSNKKIKRVKEAIAFARESD